MINNKKKIVILGAGFGGLYTYLGLRKLYANNEGIEVVLVNINDYFLFVPMLHEVATGGLQSSSIVQSLRSISRTSNFRFIQGKAVSVDMDKQVIDLECGYDDKKKHERQLSYDYLVMSLGSVTNFFDIPGVKENALTLRDVAGAQKIRDTLIKQFELASSVLGLRDSTVLNEFCLGSYQDSQSLQGATLSLVDNKEIERLLRFVIVGGGATGVELAGEMADLCSHGLKKEFPNLYDKVQIILIHSADRLVDKAHQWFARKVSDILRNKMKVVVMLNEWVSGVTKYGVSLDSKEIEAGKVIWVAGVKATPIKIKADKEIEYEQRTERIKVNNYLQIPTYGNVMVVGDQAWVHDKKIGQPYPMRAQFAVREGYVASRNILHMIDKEPLEEFFWMDQGFILSLGKGVALIEIRGYRFSGLFAWWMYRTIYLFKLIAVKIKIRTIIK